MLVKIIPTGKAELLGLEACLQRLFPDHSFETVKGGIDENGEVIPLNGFTTSEITNPQKIGTCLSKLIEQLAAEAHPGRYGNPADLAILIDDLELANISQPNIVVESVRNAVQAHLRKLNDSIRSANTMNLVQRALQDKASFHLAVPMVEAWFFADHSALPHAGVRPERLPPRIRAGIDPEQFETDDEAFSVDDGCGCTHLHQRNLRLKERSRRKVPWLFKDEKIQRERHPKAYLSWLCRDPEDSHCTTYRESHQGVQALQSLNWSKVLGHPDHCAFARAFIDDLIDKLGQPAFPLPQGNGHSLVSRKYHATRVLRNI